MKRVLDITAEQAAYLLALNAEASQATSRRDAALTMLLRGQGITEASATHLDGTTLTVTVPDPQES